MNKKAIPGTIESWEDGTLGNSAAHVRQSPAEISQQINDAIGMQAISLRLPKATIETYKNLAKMHGVGYQPLMRDAICRWAEGELKQLLIGAIESQRVLTTRKSSKPQAETVIPTAKHVAETPEPQLKKAA